jgi:hypothetical protein
VEPDRVSSQRKRDLLGSFRHGLQHRPAVEGLIGLQDRSFGYFRIAVRRLYADAAEARGGTCRPSTAVEPDAPEGLVRGKRDNGLLPFQNHWP